MNTPLMPEAERVLSFQSYAGGPEIDGVYLQPLAKHRALEGSFMEHLRITDGQAEGLPAPFEVRQISVSHAVPHRINAFHVHPLRQQDELWCVLDGTLLVWLVDVRAGSSTAGARRAFTLTGEAPSMLHIPSGVAHGFRAGHAGALLLYALNSQFDRAEPNEGRLPWDHFGAELWEPDRG